MNDDEIVHQSDADTLVVHVNNVYFNYVTIKRSEAIALAYDLDSSFATGVPLEIEHGE